MAYLIVVDDDPDFADAVAAALRSDGHETHTENEPERALEAIAKRTPDGVILDVMFPEDPCGGFELARTISRSHRDLPILMLTAVNDRYPLGFSERDIDSTWMPVCGFLEKPVDFAVLKERVRQLLAQARAGQNA